MKKKTLSDHNSIHGHRNLNETECSVITQYQNFNAPKICKITVYESNERRRADWTVEAKINLAINAGLDLSHQEQFRWLIFVWGKLAILHAKTFPLEIKNEGKIVPNFPACSYNAQEEQRAESFV